MAQLNDMGRLGDFARGLFELVLPLDGSGQWKYAAMVQVWLPHAAVKDRFAACIKTTLLPLGKGDVKPQPNQSNARCLPPSKIIGTLRCPLAVEGKNS